MLKLCEISIRSSRLKELEVLADFDESEQQRPTCPRHRTWALKCQAATYLGWQKSCGPAKIAATLSQSPQKDRQMICSKYSHASVTVGARNESALEQRSLLMNMGHKSRQQEILYTHKLEVGGPMYFDILGVLLTFYKRTCFAGSHTFKGLSSVLEKHGILSSPRW